MNMPGFDAEKSLGPTMGIYCGKADFGRSGADNISLAQEFVDSSTLSQNLGFPLVGGIGRDRLSRSLPPEGCVSIHYVPECSSPNPFTECCTTRSEIRCTECHSTLSNFPINGVFKV